MAKGASKKSKRRSERRVFDLSKIDTGARFAYSGVVLILVGIGYLVVQKYVLGP